MKISLFKQNIQCFGYARVLAIAVVVMVTILTLGIPTTRELKSSKMASQIDTSQVTRGEGRLEILHGDYETPPQKYYFIVFDDNSRKTLHCSDTFPPDLKTSDRVAFSGEFTTPEDLVLNCQQLVKIQPMTQKGVSNKGLVGGKPKPILEVLLSYDMENPHNLVTIKELRKKTGFAPLHSIAYADMVAEILDRNDLVLKSVPFKVENEFMIDNLQKGANEPLSGRREILKQVDFLLTLDLLPDAEKIRIAKKSGEVLASEDITGAPYYQTRPNFKSPPNTRVLANNNNKLDIVFISSGYTTAQMSAFHTRVDGMMTFLKTLEPFKSRASGISYNYIDNPTNICPSADLCNLSAAATIANNSQTPYDKIVILNKVNGIALGAYCGSTVMISDYAPGQDFAHEFGHVMCLWDEYNIGNSTGEVSNSVHLDTCYSTDVAPATNPAIEWAGIVPNTSYYLGCFHNNWYRSSEDSIMRNPTINSTFNVVGQKVINRELDRYIHSGQYFDLSITLLGTGKGRVTSNPQGINCGVNCKELYGKNTSVVLTVLPDSGSVFSGWSGACSGTTTTCTVSVDSTKNVVAKFTNNSNYTITVTEDPCCLITSSPIPSEIQCGNGGSCSASYPRTKTVKITAQTIDTTYPTGLVYCSEDASCATVNSSEIDVNGSRGNVEIRVTFDTPPQYASVTITKPATNTGTGKVNVEYYDKGYLIYEVNSDISSTDLDFLVGQKIEVTATADIGSVFTGWGGVCSGTTCEFTVSNAATTVTAGFMKGIDLSVFKLGGNGTVTSVPAGINCGTVCTKRYTTTPVTVTLKAVAGTGYKFIRWNTSLCGYSTSPSCTITNLSATKSIPVSFGQAWILTTTTNSVNGGKGNVTSTAPVGGINCTTGVPATDPAGDCSESYFKSPQTTVTLKAVPLSGSSFTGWTGACTGTNATCSVVMSANRLVTAKFTKP